MFDVGFSEILLIAIAALVAIGPKDLPDMLFRLGRLTRQAKMFMNGVRNQYADIMHEAEVTHYRKELSSLVHEEKETVMPAKAGNHENSVYVDPRLRGDDEEGRDENAQKPE